MTTPIFAEQHILACVDQSHFAEYVTDYAAWCALGLSLPLEFLHVLDRHPERSTGADHSGSLGVSEQDSLLNTLVTEEAARSKANRERGRLFLSSLRARAMAAGVDNPSIRQRYGELEATLVEQEPGVEMFLLGRRGESAEATGRDLGRNLERMVRALKRPILAVSEPFTPPKRVLLAFDGGAITKRGIELIAASPLFKPLAVDIAMAGDVGRRGAAMLEEAVGRLSTAGIDASGLTFPGDPEHDLAAAIRQRNIDMLVMGAYTHSVLRRLFMGSRTSNLLRAVTIPTLLLR